MANEIINNPHKLMNMSREELDETLLDEKYNKALLRELIRRLVKTSKEYRDLVRYEYEGKIPTELTMLLMRIEGIEGIKDYCLHRNYQTGQLELNIEFENDRADGLLLESNLKEIDSIAFWE